MYTLVLVRHGESVMNRENRFCGWIDVDLSPSGESEALSAAEALREANLKFAHVFTSVLRRAINTSKLILEHLKQSDIPSLSNWRLNERHYGSLQGLNKSEVAEKYGEDQVKLWRRSYDIPPPPCDVTSENYPENDPKYADIPKNCIPNGESLKLTLERVVPYWDSTIVPELRKGLPILIVEIATLLLSEIIPETRTGLSVDDLGNRNSGELKHGACLRALLKHLVKMSNSEILEFNLPTAVPMVLELDEHLNVVSKKFLMDEDELKAKMEAVASQGKKKTA